MGGGSRGKSGPRKAKPVAQAISVKLEDVYKGTSIKKVIKRQRCCETCDGKGGSDVKTCSKCKGRGIIEKMIQLGPGMFQHARSACGDCRGQGKTVEEKNKCKVCKGEKIMIKSKELDIPIEAGVPNDHQIPFTGEGDEAVKQAFLFPHWFRSLLEAARRDGRRRRLHREN